MTRPKFTDYIKERLQNKVFIACLVAYFLYLMTSLIYFSINFNLRNILLSVVYNLAIILIVVVEYFMGIRLGSLFTFLILFVAFGGHGGPCYNIYAHIPFFDTLLHLLSGVLFACVGFSVAEKFFGKATTTRKFFGCIFFAYCFSQMIAVFWELFEYMFTTVFDIEMMADEMVDRINSFYLSGDYNDAVILENIEKTTIYYGDEQTFTMKGYLDLGIIDTMTDLIICTLGGVAFMGASTLSYFYFPKLNKVLIPQSVEKIEKPKQTKKETKEPEIIEEPERESA